MKDSMWLTAWVSIVSICLCSVMFINYYMDPLWIFPHRNQFNQYQYPFNERIQKTNYLTFRPFDYDTLIIGSSRTAYLNQHTFADTKAFNYSVAGMSVREYKNYIDYSSKLKGKDIPLIIIGLDFETTNLKLDRKVTGAQAIINKSNEPFYAVKNLLSEATLQWSWRTYQYNINDYPKPFYYDRQNTRHLLRMDSNWDKIAETHVIANQLDQYQYNPEVKRMYQALIREYPKTTFLVFITPVSTDLLNHLLNLKTLQGYKQWLSDIVAVFGQVHNYLYLNSFTSDSNLFVDPSHFTPDQGDLIIKRLMGQLPPAEFQDGGFLVNQNNLQSHLQQITKQMKVNLP